MSQDSGKVMLILTAGRKCAAFLECCSVVLTKIIPPPGNRFSKTVIDMADALVRDYAESCVMSVPIIWVKKNEVCLQSCQIDTFYKYWFFKIRDGFSHKWQKMFPANVNLISFKITVSETKLNLPYYSSVLLSYWLILE